MSEQHLKSLQSHLARQAKGTSISVNPKVFQGVALIISALVIIGMIFESWQLSAHRVSKPQYREFQDPNHYLELPEWMNR